MIFNIKEQNGSVLATVSGRLDTLEEAEFEGLD